MNKKKREKKNIFQRIGDFFKKSWENYNKIPQRTRSIINLWVIIIIIMLFIIIICNINNKNLSRYTKFETKMEKAAIKYADDKNLGGINTQKVRLDLGALCDAGYLDIDKKTKDECVGYVLVYTNSDDEEKADAYLYCKGYTTDGFSFK